MPHIFLFILATLFTTRLFAQEVPIGAAAEWSGSYSVVECQYCPDHPLPDKTNLKNLYRFSIGLPERFEKPLPITGHTYNQLFSLARQSDDRNISVTTTSWIRSGVQEIAEVSQSRFFWESRYFNLKRRVIELTMASSDTYHLYYYEEHDSVPNDGMPKILQYKALLKREY